MTLYCRPTYTTSQYCRLCINNAGKSLVSSDSAVLTTIGGAWLEWRAAAARADCGVRFSDGTMSCHAIGGTVIISRQNTQ